MTYPLGRGYRSLSPVLYRFLSADNLSPFFKGGINSYCYVSGDPVNRSDPSGHMMKNRQPLAVPPADRLKRARELVFKREAVVEGFVKHVGTLHDLEANMPRLPVAPPEFPKLGMANFKGRASDYARFIDSQAKLSSAAKQAETEWAKLALMEKEYSAMQNELSLYVADVATQTGKRIPGLNRSLSQAAGELRDTQDVGLYEKVYRKKYFEWSTP